MHRVAKFGIASFFILLPSIFLGGCSDDAEWNIPYVVTDLNGSDPIVSESDLISAELPIGITALRVDKERSKIYISDIYTQRLYIVDLMTGEIDKYFEFAFMPERMTMTPDGSRLYLALLVQEHDSQWMEVDQSGYIAVFDLDQQDYINTFTIDIDPYDLVATDSKFIVSSGSGQWTSIYAYDANSGLELGNAVIRQASHLSLHPSEDWVFAANTDISPSDIEKFDITGQGIVAVGDSPYHGEHRMDGNVWSTPDGQYVITRGGDVFLASDDMTFVTSMTANDQIEGIALDADENVIITIESKGRMVRYYDMTSFTMIGTVDVTLSDVDWLFVADGELNLVKQLPFGQFELLQVTHPCSGCGG